MVKITFIILGILYLAAIPTSLNTAKTVCEVYGEDKAKAFFKTWLLMPWFLMGKLFK